MLEPGTFYSFLLTGIYQALTGALIAHQAILWAHSGPKNVFFMDLKNGSLELIGPFGALRAQILFLRITEAYL